MPESGTLTESKRFSLVGLSAAEFASKHDRLMRGYLLKELAAADYTSLLEVVRRNDWWSDLDRIFNQLSLDREEMSATMWSVGPNISTHKAILARVTDVIPDLFGERVAFSPKGPNFAEVWSELYPKLGSVGYPAFVRLVRIALNAKAISARDAMELILSRNRTIGEGEISGGIQNELFETLKATLPGLNAADSRRLLEAFIDSESIVNSSTGYGETERHSFVYRGTPLIYDCAALVTEQMNEARALAWASRLLVDAFKQSYRKWNIEFQGRELFGGGHSMLGNMFTYKDNGWLLKVILPIERRRIERMTVEELRDEVRRWRGFSARNPAFKLRATILALTAQQLGALAQELVALTDLEGGLPAIRSVIARRSKDSLELAQIYIEQRLATVGVLESPDEAAILHNLILANVDGAREVALGIVRDARFARTENLFTGFFSQLNWAENDPSFALMLVEEAIEHGYKPDIMNARHIVGIIKAAVAEPSLRERILRNDQLRQEMPYVISDDPALYAKYASWLFGLADRYGKMEILRTVADRDLVLALEIVGLALHDPDPRPEAQIELEQSVNQITGVRTSAYFALHLIYATHRMGAFDEAPFDILRLASLETGPYGAHHAILALGSVVNAAFSEKRDDVAQTTLALIQGFIGINNQFIRADVANVLASHWWRLNDHQIAWFWRNLSDTEQAGSAAIALALRNQDKKQIALARDVFAQGSAKMRQHMAWYLWRSIDNEERPYSLDTPVVATMLEFMAEEPDVEVYATLTRLFCHAAISEPRQALRELIKICERALKHRIFFPIYFPEPVNFAAAPAEEVVGLGERLLSVSDNGDAYSMVSLVADCLMGVIKPELVSRTQKVFEGLPRIPYVTERHHIWRDMISK